MRQPSLVQFGDLTAKLLAQHPIWVACHGVDYDEPWYEETNEETFRPWTGEHPVGCERMFLVSCKFWLSDGTELSGFATPSDKANDFGSMQPQLFDPSGKRHSFWLRMFPDEADIEALRIALSRPSARVFPIVFEALPGLARAPCGGTVRGFLKADGDKAEVIKLSW